MTSPPGAPTPSPISEPCPNMQDNTGILLIVDIGTPVGSEECDTQNVFLTESVQRTYDSRYPDMQLVQLQII